jgi:hypothetical protein
MYSFWGSFFARRFDYSVFSRPWSRTLWNTGFGRFTPEPTARLALASWRFVLAAALTAVVLSILMLPMLPTNDGPLHAYYSQVFSDLLTGHSTYSHTYQIRSVFPPYAVHLYLLMALNRFLDPYLTERIIACIAILLTFSGFIRLSKALGRSTIWGSFLVLPFLANWILYMGFTNYALGLATLLFAIGYWLQHIEGFGARQAVFTAILVFALAAEHPVPLFLFFVFVGIEFLTSYSLRRVDGNSSRNLGGLLNSFNQRRLPMIVVSSSALVTSVWIQAFLGKGSIPVHLPTLKEVAKRVVSLVTLNEISPYSFSWWFYTLALLVVAIPATVLALRRLRTEWRDPKIAAIGWLLLFCVAAYLVIPEQLNGGFHLHRRFSSTAIFLVLALASGAPVALSIQRIMAAIAIAAVTFTTALQVKANRTVIAHLAPSIAPCVVPAASRFLVIRFGTPDYGHPLRYMLDHAVPGYWSSRCHAVFINSTWLSQPIYPLRTAPGVPWDIKESDAALALCHVVDRSLPLPYAPDVIAIEAFSNDREEPMLLHKLESQYGFHPIPGVRGDYIYLFRSL